MPKKFIALAHTKTIKEKRLSRVIGNRQSSQLDPALVGATHAGPIEVVVGKPDRSAMIGMWMEGSGFSTGNFNTVFTAIEQGLPVAIVDAVADYLDISAGKVLYLTRISTSTFARRKHKGLLSADESDRLFRLQFITGKAVEFFEGNREAANRWLQRPAAALNGAKPIDMLINEAGVREVEDLLIRLDDGVFT